MNTFYRRIIGSSLLCVAVCSALAQQPAQLLVRADDLGSFHAANKACIESYTDGIVRSVEVMVVTPWFPEAVKMLKQNPGLDVGLHLTFTSEWENVKWRPITNCPGLTDSDGYFLPMMSPNKNYPGLAVKENAWKLDEVVNEARAQIELALKHLPQLTHISGHMGSTGFTPEVRKALTALADEYHLVLVDRAATGYQFLTYEGTHATVAEKEAAFLKTLEKVQSGGRYMFLDHPGRNNEEMESVGHIGYEDVAADRQGVTELFTSPKVKQVLQERNIELVSYNEFAKGLPRAEASPRLKKAMDRYLKAVAKEQPDLHSIMVVQRGKVQAEHYLNGWHRQDRHTMYSVTKTFTAMAVGFAIQERLLNVSDKVISFFPDKLPTQVSERLAKLEIRHLLTMTSGFHTSPSNRIKQTDSIDWVRAFLTIPLEHDPGTAYTYSSMNSYMLSAIVQKVTGQKLIDYLYPRLFRPLGITGFTWRESAQNICQGGWGLTIKTEDMAKLGLLILQKGRWKGKQLISEEWIDEMSSYKVDSRPVAQKPEDIKTPVKRNDWLQGYCYQMWRCTHNAVRADGANGQYILILPDKQAVITTTADVRDMQQELDLIWKYIYPAL